MRPLVHHRLGVLAITVAGASLAGSIALRAAQAPAPQRTMIPLAASSVILHPDAHYGEYGSIPAAVEQILSKTAFTVDQDKTKTTGQELLVIAPTLQEAPEVNTYVTIVGEVIKFEPEEIAKRAKDYTLDVPPDVIERFRGKPAVLATSVIAPNLKDIAKRPPPPMTPAELALSKTMKTVQPTVGSLRTAIDASNAADVKKGADTLKTLFLEVQLFFKQRGTADAQEWAGNAMKLADTIGQAAATGKWDDAKTGAASLQQLCTTCHTAHRERVEDGTYRVKG